MCTNAKGFRGCAATFSVEEERIGGETVVVAVAVVLDVAVGVEDKCNSINPSYHNIEVSFSFGKFIFNLSGGSNSRGCRQ